MVMMVMKFGWSRVRGRKKLGAVEMVAGYRIDYY